MRLPLWRLPLLPAVAQRLRRVLRADDLVARLAGDEFVLVLNDSPSDAQVQAVMQAASDVVRMCNLRAAEGFIAVDAHQRSTSHPNVFAAGDVTTVPYKQIVIAAGEGAKAALSAFDYLIRQPVVA